MKRILLISMALSIGHLAAHDETTPSAPAASTTPAKPGYKDLTTKELKELIDKKASITIVDARGINFDDGQRIPGGKLLPFNSTPARIAEVIPTKDTVVVVYCTSNQCPLSKHLAATLVKLGYTNVKRYPDGLEGWLAAGYKTTKETK